MHHHCTITDGGIIIVHRDLMGIFLRLDIAEERYVPTHSHMAGAVDCLLQYLLYHHHVLYRCRR